MKKVVISVNSKGEFYVISAPKKVIVEFKQPKKRSFKKRIRTWIYRIKAGE